VLAGLPEEERVPAMFLVLDRIWSQLRDAGEPTLIVVDEAWWLMQHEDTARFLFRLAKTARKRRAGLTLITQDVSDVLANQLGETLITNAALQVLMKQAPQALPKLAELFRLTDAEQAWLLNARPGEGLLLAQGRRVPFVLLPSQEELRLIKSGEPGGRQAA
jgi:type IV secretory pathway VirB4 component